MSNETIPEKKPLTVEYLKHMDAYWLAANYFSAALLLPLLHTLRRQPPSPPPHKSKLAVP